MQILILKSLWGMDDAVPLARRLDAIREGGYDGVEYNSMIEDPGEIRDLCESRGLAVVAQLFAANREEFMREMKRVAPFGPLRISSQSGRDRMSFEEGSAFFDTALEIEERYGVPVAHETHRYRIFYSPWQTLPYLRKYPTLKILADFSHWCVVCESNLDDAKEILDLSCSRAVHIHGRVGYEEGPQVPDPAAPEYRASLERHERWWDQIRAERERQGDEILTFTPEYGPPAYLHTLPHTGEPVADLWKVCLWAADRVRTRWELKPG